MARISTKDDYFNVTKEENLAVFIRSIVGIEQEAINQKFSEYLKQTFYHQNSKNSSKVLSTMFDKTVI